MHNEKKKNETMRPGKYLQETVWFVESLHTIPKSADFGASLTCTLLN